MSLIDKTYKSFIIYKTFVRALPWVFALIFIFIYVSLDEDQVLNQFFIPAVVGILSGLTSNSLFFLVRRIRSPGEIISIKVNLNILNFAQKALIFANFKQNPGVSKLMDCTNDEIYFSLKAIDELVTSKRVEAMLHDDNGLCRQFLDDILGEDYFKIGIIADIARIENAMWNHRMYGMERDCLESLREDLVSLELAYKEGLDASVYIVRVLTTLMILLRPIELHEKNRRTKETPVYFKDRLIQKESERIYHHAFPYRRR